MWEAAARLAFLRSWVAQAPLRLRRGIVVQRLPLLGTYVMVLHLGVVLLIPESFLVTERHIGQ